MYCTFDTIQTISDTKIHTYDLTSLLRAYCIEYANKEEAEQLRPYTMQEIDDMLDEAENAFEAGEYLTLNEVFHRKQEKPHENTDVTIFTLWLSGTHIMSRKIRQSKPNSIARKINIAYFKKISITSIYYATYLTRFS